MGSEKKIVALWRGIYDHSRLTGIWPVLAGTDINRLDADEDFGALDWRAVYLLVQVVKGCRALVKIGISYRTGARSL